MREVRGEATAYACDVTDSDAVARLVAACRDAHGRIDVLVNNVGVRPSRADR